MFTLATKLRDKKGLALTDKFCHTDYGRDLGRIIAGPNGERKPPVKTKYSREYCDMRALIEVFPGDLILEARVGKGTESIKIFRVRYLDYENAKCHIEEENIFMGKNPETHPGEVEKAEVIEDILERIKADPEVEDYKKFLCHFLVEKTREGIHFRDNAYVEMRTEEERMSGPMYEMQRRKYA